MNKEQIKSLAEKITKDSILCSSLGIARIITDWFEQNPQKPVVVGLSDSQLQDFHKCRYKDYLSFTDFKVNYQAWAKTQTFAQPLEVSSNTYNKLVSDYEDLQKELAVAKAQVNSLVESNRKAGEELKQLKAQVFQPDWSDAPEWANWLAQDKCGTWCWFEDKPDVDGSIFEPMENSRFSNHNFVIENWKETLQQRPTPPAPKVEVGQVWKGDISNYSVEVKSITKLKAGNFICVKTFSNSFPVYSEEDFLAKFEQVQS